MRLLPRTMLPSSSEHPKSRPRATASRDMIHLYHKQAAVVSFHVGSPTQKSKSPAKARGAKQRHAEALCFDSILKAFRPWPSGSTVVLSLRMRTCDSAAGVRPV